MALTYETARLLGGKCCLLTITHGGSWWRSVLERESSEVPARSPVSGAMYPHNVRFAESGAFVYNSSSYCRKRSNSLRLA